MTIDLSQYVGKTIVVELRDQSVLAGPLEKDTHYSDIVYPYKISGWLFNESGVGMSKPKIIKILTPFEESGIAQKAPNINLDDFVGQTVMIKTRMDEYFVGELDEGLYLGNLCSYSKTGYSLRNGNLDIMEIYGRGAYEINTKSTFDNPNDYKIEQAKQLLSQMSEEQIAKLLKSLKSNP
jgi:hypothetical protein